MSAKILNNFLSLFIYLFLVRRNDIFYFILSKHFSLFSLFFVFDVRTINNKQFSKLYLFIVSASVIFRDSVSR